jgi:hypothetical protein
VTKNIKNIIFYSLSFIVLWALCIIRVAPTYLADDSPETITAMYTLGLQHPPGYAINNLIGKIFQLIPVGNIIFRAGLMAMFFHIAAAFILFMLIVQFFNDTKKKNEIFFLAFIASIFYLFSYSAFLQGLSAKGSVYTIQALFTVVIFLSLLKLKKEQKYLYLASFIYGLSLGNHWQSSSVILPALVLFLYLDKIKLSTKSISISMIFFLIGCSIFSYIFIRNAAHPVYFWGNVKDIEGFFWMLSRSQYSGIENTHLMTDSVRLAIYYFINVLPEQYPVLLSLLLIPGIFLMINKNRTYGITVVVAYITVLLAVFSVMTFKQGLEWYMKPYLTFTYLFIAIFIVFIFNYVLEKIKDKNIKKISIFVISPIVFFMFYLNTPDYSKYFLGYDYTSNAFTALPDGCIYFAEGDVNYFGAIYKRIIEKKNINVIGIALLQYDWYREQLKKNYEGAVTITDKAMNATDDLKNLIRANMGKNMYYSNARSLDLSAYSLKHEGIVNEIENSNTQNAYNPYVYFKLFSLRGMFDNDKKYDEFTKLYTFTHYGMNLQELADECEAKGDFPQAIFLSRKALMFYNNDLIALKLGWYYIKINDYNQAEIYLNQALQINPNNSKAQELLTKLKNYLH